MVLLLKFPHLVEKVRDSGVAGKLGSKWAQGLIERILDAKPEGFPASLLAGIQDEDLRGRLGGKVMNDGAFPQDKAESLLEECILGIRRRHMRGELRRLTERIGRAEREGRTEERKRLQRSKILLDRELTSLKISSGKPL